MVSLDSAKIDGGLVVLGIWASPYDEIGRRVGRVWHVPVEVAAAREGEIIRDLLVLDGEEERLLASLTRSHDVPDGG